jgi:hypothetical protein
LAEELARYLTGNEVFSDAMKARENQSGREPV